VLACALRALELCLQGALLPAAVVTLGGGALTWGLWLQLRQVVAVCARLRLYPDGRVLFSARQAVVEARVASCSLRLGSHVLLVLHTDGQRPLRLLLGPQILSAQDCAALGRWLKRVPGTEGPGARATALD
jgi:hypothetical protein